MRALHSHICAASECGHRQTGIEHKVRSVGLIHSERNAAVVRHTSKSCNISDSAKICRRHSQRKTDTTASAKRLLIQRPLLWRRSARSCRCVKCLR